MNDKYFEVSVNDPKGLLGRPFAISRKKDGKILVDKFMRNRDGRPFEVEMLGPMWVSARTRGKGGRASIDSMFSAATTDEIKKWKKWDAYVVEAAAFRGAISGTWYYDTKTGFLVGLERKNVVTSFLTAHPPYWILEDTNITASGTSSPAAKQPTDEPSEKAVQQAAPKQTHAIILKNGRSIKGVLLQDKDTHIVLEMEGGTITMNKQDIQAINPID